jgi:hypothetical protein
MDITVIKFMLIFRLDGQNRFGFHQKGCNKVHYGYGPESGKKQEYDGNDPPPKNGKIEIISKASDDTQYDAIPGTIQP